MRAVFTGPAQATAQRIAATLEIAPPRGADLKELREWVEWWEPCFRIAAAMSETEKARLKAGRWWPPLVAAHISYMPPDIVKRTLRPDLRAL